MVFKNIPLTKPDFNSLHWEQLIDECPEKECSTYMEKFFAKAKEAESAGDDKACEIYTLLGAICSFHSNPENKDEPFGPMLVTSASRSAMVDDITNEHFLALQEIVADVRDPEISARIADVLWLRKRDFRAAGIAVDAYLESATILENPESWPPCFERIERAFRLAAQLGTKTGFLRKVIVHIESLLRKYNGEDPLYLSAKLMELLLERREGDPARYSALSEKIARKAESMGDYDRSRTYWEIKARWDRLSGDSNAQKNAEILAAETYVKKAEEADSSLVASTWLEKAIEVYRRIGGQNQRIDEIHSRLIEIQKAVPDEMKEISHTMDIAELVERHIDRIKGRKLHDALLKFCLMGTSPSVRKLKERVEDSIKNHPLLLLFPEVIVNDKGKVIGRKPNMMSSDPDEIERAKKAEMYSQAQIGRNIVTHGLIEPVRRQIISEHYVQIRDFYPIVIDNPFVPEGREQIFAQGLHAGLMGDYVIAAHLLIPQVENLIRYLLEQKGATVSRIDDQGIQDERPLNEILYFPEIKEIFGEDLAFDLRGLLVERFGANLRNRVAHGLISYEGFYAVEVPYFWWMTLRLCCLPIISHLRKKQKEQSFESGGEQGK